MEAKKRTDSHAQRRINLVVVYIVVVIALLVTIYVVPGVTGYFTATYVAEYGELSLSDETTGYVIRQEIVYTAESGGTENAMVSEGDLVRTGTAILQVDGSGDQKREEGDPMDALAGKVSRFAIPTSDFICQHGGIISFYGDGYELELHPGNLDTVSKETLEKLSQDDVLDLKTGQINQGDPVFKIIDKSRWYMILFVDKDHIERYQPGATVMVAIGEDRENPIAMDVRSATQEDGKGRIVLETNRFYDQLGKIRVSAVTVVTHQVRGLMMDSASLTTQDGVTGVYVKNTAGSYDFVPVEVLGQDGDLTVIADSYYYDEEGIRQPTVSPYDDIKRKPES